jgi:hypothetical protein
MEYCEKNSLLDSLKTFDYKDKKSLIQQLSDAFT